MKGSFTLPKFRCKTFDAWNKIVSRHVLQEKLGSLVGVLHIPAEIWLKRKWVFAPQPQRGSFRDSDVAVRLGHWLGSWNINTESVNSAKQKSLFKVKPEQRSMYGQDSKMEQYSPQQQESLKHQGEHQGHGGAVKRQWAAFWVIPHRQKSHDWGTWIQVALRLRRNDRWYWFLLLMETLEGAEKRGCLKTSCL